MSRRAGALGGAGENGVGDESFFFKDFPYQRSGSETAFIEGAVDVSEVRVIP